MNEAILYDANKKNGFISAILNLLIPGCGYFYCGMPITGVVVLFITIIFSVLTLFAALPLFSFIFFIAGFFAAKKANKKLAMKLSEQSAVNNAPKATFNNLSNQPIIPNVAIPNTEPSYPANVATVTQNNQRGDSALFRGLQFIVAKCGSGIDWKNEYDFISVETGRVVLQAREGEISKMAKVQRLGDTANATKFDVMLTLEDGAQLLRYKGGGISTKGEVFDSRGTKIASLNRAGITSLNTRALDERGTIFFTKSKGLGMMTSKHEILTEKGGQKIGLILDINKSDAGQALGHRMNLLNDNYDYAYSINLDTELDDKAKSLLMAAVYLIAHSSGRA